MQTTTIERTLSGDIQDVPFSTMNLSRETLDALRAMGIEDPTPIQSNAMPHLLKGKDVIGQARTGSGKTLAFAIPAIEAVDPRRRAVQVLVLTPTRELAAQVGSVFNQVVGRRGIQTALVFGGRGIQPQISAIRRGAQVVVGTPGRILDLLRQNALRLDGLRMLVLDEADEMLDRGFAPDVERIISHTPNDRQTALFSATLPEWVQKTANKHLRDAVTVHVDPNGEDRAEIDHIAYDLPDGDKLTALTDLLDLRSDGSIIVFGRTKHGVKKLAGKLEGLGYPVAALQGNLSQNARDRVMEEFRAGRVQILLATNVAARGLDITSIAQVINFDLPESPELLTHRVGRTGRMGRAGQAITLLGPEDGAKWRQLERGLAHHIPRGRWPGAQAAIEGTADALRSAPAVERRESPPQRFQPRVERPESRPVQRRHEVTCHECGEHAQVPFVPDPSRPVYCGACFQAAKSRRLRRAPQR